MLLVDRHQSAEAARILALPRGSAGATDSQLAWASRVVAATRHPSAGYCIPRPLRVAAFPWMNVPLVSMFLFAGSLQAILILQVVNQMFNASFNLANGATGALGASRLEIARNFIAATTVACAVAMAGRGLENMLSSVARGALSRWFVPFLSVVSADVVNVGFSRFEEYTRGVPICDRSGRRLGMSCVAGRAVVAKALATRSVLLPLAALSVPTMLSSVSRGIFSVAPSSAPALVMEVVFVALTLAVGLPACIALFPETLRLPLGQLERSAQLAANQACEPGRPPADVFVYRGV